MKSNPINALVHGFKNYANFTGRSTRAQYWYWILSTTIITRLAAYLDGLLFPSNVDTATTMENLSIGGYWIEAVVGLALFVPGMAIAVRRIRDAGGRGWFYAFNILPLLAFGAFVYIAFSELTKFGIDFLGQDLWANGLVTGIAMVGLIVYEIAMMLSSGTDATEQIQAVTQAFQGTITSFFVMAGLTLAVAIFLFIYYVRPTYDAGAAAEPEAPAEQ